MMPDGLLLVRHLSKRFGGVHALEGVDFHVPEGAIYAVIGPNGAGKTTLFNCLNGIVRPTTGEIEFAGRSIAGCAPHRVAQRGIARTWQTIRLFEHMTVLENVMVGCHPRSRSGFIPALFRLPPHGREERDILRWSMEQLALLDMAQHAQKPVSTLPFLQQRRVELARALAAEPRLLLLDEPAAGLNTRETAQLGALIREVRDRGITILLVEHDMSLVMEISDTVFVLDHGTPIAEGPPREIQENEKVIAVYLGTDEEEG